MRPIYRLQVPKAFQRAYDDGYDFDLVLRPIDPDDLLKHLREV